MERVTSKDAVLKSGHRMPIIGLGTWRLTSRQAERICAEAIALGYRLIDTAENYANEEGVGNAIKGADRQTLFITTKVEPSHAGRSDLVDACRRSLDRLQTEYIDLYLMHWPSDTIPEEETMEGMTWLVEKGLVRSVGVSNYGVPRLRKAMSVSDVPICNNQIEYHPLRNRDDILAFCRDHAITVTAYSPLAQGEVFTDPLLKEMAAKYRKSPAQVSLRWLLQMGAAVIPKASSIEHLEANLDLDDFDLAPDDLRRIHDMAVERRLIDTWT